MTRYRVSSLVALLLSACGMLLAGCADFITEAARANLASFIVDIFETAVNSTIAP
jgi:hypothetical protein